VLAVADCELVGRQVGIATATDEVGAISVVVSVNPIETLNDGLVDVSVICVIVVEVGVRLDASVIVDVVSGALAMVVGGGAD